MVRSAPYSSSSAWPSKWALECQKVYSRGVAGGRRVDKQVW
jgi:hypothetical protein